VGLLDALGMGRAHIVGASMGGAIAQEVAMRHPSHAKSLVSIMASSGDPMLPPPKPEAMAILFTPTPTDLTAFVERYKATWKVLRAGSFPDDEALDPARAERMYSRGINPAGVARQLAAILASGSRKPRLASLKVPTLVLHGAADPLVPIEHGRDVAATVPGARLTVIERMGHALPVSMWPQIVDAIASHAQAADV
jgi:pimeloyl-ACP methyl ester carboxylesterase